MVYKLLMISSSKIIETNKFNFFIIRFLVEFKKLNPIKCDDQYIYFFSKKVEFGYSLRILLQCHQMISLDKNFIEPDLNGFSFRLMKVLGWYWWTERISIWGGILIGRIWVHFLYKFNTYTFYLS